MIEMSPRFTESVVEDAALAWLDGLGYAILHGPDIAPGEPFTERRLHPPDAERFPAEVL